MAKSVLNIVDDIAISTNKYTEVTEVLQYDVWERYLMTDGSDVSNSYLQGNR